MLSLGLIVWSGRRVGEARRGWLFSLRTGILSVGTTDIWGQILSVVEGSFAPCRVLSNRWLLFSVGDGRYGCHGDTAHRGRAGRDAMSQVSGAGN